MTTIDPVARILPHPSLKVPLKITGKDCLLQLVTTFSYGNNQIVGAEFDILVDGSKAGVITALLEKNHEKIKFIGNVGVRATPSFYGKKIPSRATRALFPLFRDHNIGKILITCDESNDAIITACNELEGEFLDVMLQQETGRIKKRWIVSVNQPDLP